MKKILLIIGIVFCLWKLAQAQPLNIPGSQFPIVHTPSNYYRFIMVNTNGNTPGSTSVYTSSNATVEYDDLATSIGNNQSNKFDLSGTANTYNTATSNGLVSLNAGTSNSLLSTAISIFDTNGTAVNVIANYDLTNCLVKLGASSVANNFMDGITFQQRFGRTNTSLIGNPLSTTIKAFTPEGFGALVTNGIALTLPQSVSNVTVVVMCKGAPAGFGNTLFSLGNSTTKSSIEVTDDGNGNYQAWENYRGGFYNGRANPTYTNVFDPLWINEYSFGFTEDSVVQPRTLAFVRDVNATWRIYMDTIPGKIGFNTLLFTFACPTNAIDPFDTLWVGTSGVTNTSYLGDGTNTIYSSIFVFNTTNLNAVSEGYKAAHRLLDTDTADFFFGDSRMADNTLTHNNPPFFYSLKNPRHYFRNYAQGGSKVTDELTFFAANGGLNMFSNLPTDKIKFINIFNNSGINDIYGAGRTATQLFQDITNFSLQLYSFDAKTIYIDIFQVSTNAIAPYTYSLANEVTAWTVNQMIRTNTSPIGISQYVPLRDQITQLIMDTNGPYTFDGLHTNNRTNWMVSAATADLMDGRPFWVLSPTNGVVVY